MLGGEFKPPPRWLSASHNRAHALLDGNRAGRLFVELIGRRGQLFGHPACFAAAVGINKGGAFQRDVEPGFLAGVRWENAYTATSAMIAAAAPPRIHHFRPVRDGATAGRICAPAGGAITTLKDYTSPIQASKSAIISVALW